MAPGKLAKYYKAHQRANKLPKPGKIERGGAAPKKVPRGADIPRGYDPFRRQDLLDDQKKVDAELVKKRIEAKVDTQTKEKAPEVKASAQIEKKEVNVKHKDPVTEDKEAKVKSSQKDSSVEIKKKEVKVKLVQKDPNAEHKMPKVETKVDQKDPAVEAKKKEIEIKVDEKDPDVEIIHCSEFVTHVRVTNTTRANGGEMARVKKIVQNASYYPHITFHGQDKWGRTIIRRRKLEPAALKEMRDAIIECQRESNAQAKNDVGTPDDKKTQLDEKQRSQDSEEGLKKGEPVSRQGRGMEQVTTAVTPSCAAASDKKEDTNLARKKRAQETEDPEEGEHATRLVRPLKRVKVAAAPGAEKNKGKEAL